MQPPGAMSAPSRASLSAADRVLATAARAAGGGAGTSSASFGSNAANGALRKHHDISILP